MIKLYEIKSILDEFCDTESWKNCVYDLLSKSGNATKWMIYSDYCLDDSTKPNDVLTFVLMPFMGEEEYKKMDNAINELQSTDIKKVRSVKIEFLAYIKSLPIFSFSFIVNDRKLLFGDTVEERMSVVLDILGQIREQYSIWMKNASNEESVDYYKTTIKKMDNCIREIKERKNVKNIQNIILTAYLGALYSSKILCELPLDIEIVGWFPDRDKLNTAHSSLIFEIFNVLFYNQLPVQNMQFAYSGTDTEVVPFYDNENRIADYICGTIADYHIDSNRVSKDKFSEVLEKLFADNSACRIYRIKSKQSPLQIGEILVESRSTV